MNNANEQRLLVTLEARINKYEKDLARALGATNDNFQKMERRTKQSADQMEKTLGKSATGISSKLNGMFAPFLAGGAAIAAASVVSKFQKSIAEVSREADKARVTTQVWQQWVYVAKATGASVDGVTDSLKELNLRGDQFATTGKGSAAEAFDRLGYSAADVAEKLKDPSRFLEEIIGKVQKLDKAAQARVVDEIFGGTGAEEMSKMLGLSVDQIQTLRSEAALFTDAQLESAKKIDAAYETMWTNAQVYMKQAILESVSYADRFVTFLSNLKGDNIIANSRDKFLADYADNEPIRREKELIATQKQRLEILKNIAEFENKPDLDPVFDGLKLDRLKTDLAAVDNKITELTPHTNQLTSAVNNTAGAFNGTAAAAANFKNSLNELKMLVPGLKEELDQLAASDAIDKAFNAAIKNAKSPRDIEAAVDIAAQARSAAKFGSHKNILDLIGAVESGGDYNATLDNGRWTGGAQNLTTMTLDQVRALQAGMRTPENRALYGDGKGSSALGKYQIVSSTFDGLIKELGLAGDRKFDEATQDEMARALLRRRGGDVEGLRNEWAGLRNVDSTTIKNAYAGTATGAQQLAPSEGQQKAIDLAKQQDDARKGLNQTLEEGLALAQREGQISGLSASQQRIELELFRAQQELARQGITLSSQELAALREKITLTESLKQGQLTAAQQAKGLASAQMFFAESFTSSLSGLITGTTSLSDAVKNLANSLLDAVLQATLLGKGPLAALFGFGGAGQSSGILGGILGFAEGGYTGRGGKHQGAGIVHKGEFVMSAAATRKLGVDNLERLHSNAKRGFSEGGFVGGTAFKRPANMNVPAAANAAPSFQISAPITVNGSAGTPEQNDDLAAKMAKQMEGTMRGIVNSELRLQSRPGNTLNKRGR